MACKVLWAMPPILWFFALGCGYTFQEAHFIEGAKFRRTIRSPLHDNHDLDEGKATMVILSDQVKGSNIVAGNTVKLGFELQKYEVGVPIRLPSDSVVVRFSDLDGIPVKGGAFADSARGTVVILQKTDTNLTIQFDLACRTVRIEKGGAGEGEDVDLDGVYECTRLTNNLNQLLPYYGGRQGIYTDDAPDRRE